jgi:16S rRNA (cytosine967-C5)-methyltransferase
MENPRQLALIALKNIFKQGAYTNVALDRVLSETGLGSSDRGLASELVYGIVRRQRTLNALIDRLGKKKADRQPLDLRIILQIGLYQLRYLDRITDSAAVHTSVELAKINGLSKLSGVVNGILREYLRQAANVDPLPLSENPIQRLGVLYSFPDWIVENWLAILSQEKTEQLCQWFNRTPTIDLRVNPLKASIDLVEAEFLAAGISVSRLPFLPQALRLTDGSGSIQQLPGFDRGWWSVQDSSAQLVGYLLDPQPGESIVDACAAPGGKTTHIAELMGDRGKIWASDRDLKRLRKVKENAERLDLTSIEICPGDSRDLVEFKGTADRVLLDVPCSGLGILHKRPDIRWRQTPAKIEQLVLLQAELLERASTWVKPNGILVYATCTLDPLENEHIIESFLARHPHWQIETPPPNSIPASLATKRGWIYIWPQKHDMDGFFMAKLKLTIGN